MCSGERLIGAAKGKQSDTEALCQTPPPFWCTPFHFIGLSGFQAVLMEDCRLRHVTFLTTKTAVRKNQETDGRTGSGAWTSGCLRKWGEGMGHGPQHWGFAPAKDMHLAMCVWIILHTVHVSSLRHVELVPLILQNQKHPLWFFPGTSFRLCPTPV